MNRYATAVLTAALMAGGAPAWAQGRSGDHDREAVFAPDPSKVIADSERIIAKYMKINDPKLAATEFEFVAALMPDYISPTLDGIKLILENFGKEYPDAPKRDPKEFVDGSIMDRLKQDKFVEALKF